MMHKKGLLLLGIALAGVAALAAAGGSRAPDESGRKESARAQAKAKAPSKPPKLSEAEAEHLFRRILVKLQNQYMWDIWHPGCGTLGPWLGEDQRSDGPKARLFAKAYPELAKRLILEILEDPEAPAIDRGFALTVLQSLPEWTSDRLEELLRMQVEAVDPDYPDYSALRALGDRDPKLRHRDLYHRECRIGNRAAFEILSFSPHSTSIPLFQQLKRESRNRYYPLGSIPDEAEETLAKLKIFESPDWKKTVEEMIRKPTFNRYDFESVENFLWAVEVARRRELPFLLDALGERGRRGRHEKSHVDLHDIALSIFADHGGELTPAEFARFRPNGFVGNPEDRLLEIAAEEKLR